MVDPILQLMELPFVREYLKRVGGDNAIDVMRLMVEHGNAVTDEEIAQEMGVKVTVVRAVFNRLNFWGIIDYDKTRDEETGWYTYTWHIVPEKIREAVEKELQEREGELRKKRQELDQFMFFVCPEGHTREPFEVAAEYNFKCPICGKDLEPLDTDAEKRKIDKELDDIWRARKLLSEIVTKAEEVVEELPPEEVHEAFAELEETDSPEESGAKEETKKGGKRN